MTKFGLLDGRNIAGGSSKWHNIKRHIKFKIAMEGKYYKNSETKTVSVFSILLQRAHSETYREVIR